MYCSDVFINYGGKEEDHTKMQITLFLVFKNLIKILPSTVVYHKIFFHDIHIHLVASSLMLYILDYFVKEQ